MDVLTGYKLRQWRAVRQVLIESLKVYRRAMLNKWSKGKYTYSRATIHALAHLRGDPLWQPDWRLLYRLSRFCQDQEWPELGEAFAWTSEWVRGHLGVNRALSASLDRSSAICGMADPDDYPRTPEQVKCEALLSSINLSQTRGPQETEDLQMLERMELRESIQQIRASLDCPSPDSGDGLLSQALLSDKLGISRLTIHRLENLERKGSYFPRASTLRKLAALARAQGWEERAEVLEKAASQPRRHRYPEQRQRPG